MAQTASTRLYKGPGWYIFMHGLANNDPLPWNIKYRTCHEISIAEKCSRLQGLHPTLQQYVWSTSQYRKYGGWTRRYILVKWHQESARWNKILLITGHRYPRTVVHSNPWHWIRFLYISICLQLTDSYRNL